MSDNPTLADLTSKQGWVRNSCDLTKWIPCPAKFPDGFDRDSWAAAMAEGWWEQNGLEYRQVAIDKLAFMLRELHQQGYENVPCHQIWAYYRDLAVPPLPLHIGIWAMTGERDQQLRSLSGAADPDAVRPPVVTEFATGPLGAGFRTLRHVKYRHRKVCGMLGFAFRSVEFETDVQVLTGTPDLRQLQKATGDIEDFVRGMSVYHNPAPRR